MVILFWFTAMINSRYMSCLAEEQTTLLGLTALSMFLDGSLRFGLWLTSRPLQASPLAAGKGDVVPLIAIC